MKSLICILVAIFVCVVYPPWRPIGQWTLVRTGELAVPHIADELDRELFGYLPYSYGWFWQPPMYQREEGVFKKNWGPSSTTTFETKTSEIRTRIDSAFLVLQAAFFGIAASIATAGINLRLCWRDLTKSAMVVAIFMICAAFALTGFRANLIRAQSAMFPVSVVAFQMFLLGVTGMASSIFLLRFPMPAGIVATLTMLGFAGMTVWYPKCPTQWDTTRLLEIGLYLLLALAVCRMFCFGVSFSMKRRDLD
jgi:hypothetical protein